MTALQILKALGEADHDNDAYWTSEGEIKMGYIKDFLEDDGVTRSDVNAVIPEGFKRGKPELLSPPTEGGEEVLDVLPAAIGILDNFVDEVSAPRYNKNGELKNIALAWRNVRETALALQGRIDDRLSNK